MENRFEDIYKSILSAMEEMEIIDGHEHLYPEEIRLEYPVDVFTFLTGYTKGDLKIAGMSDDKYRLLFDTTLPLDYRWSILKPYWENIRYGGYARAILIALKKFYGVDDINEKTCEPVSRAMKEFNKPGLYNRVLKDTCKIKAALTQWGSTKTGNPLLIPLMPLPFFSEVKTRWGSLSRPLIDNGAMRGIREAQDDRMVWPAFGENAIINTLDDFVGAVMQYMARVKREGAVGLKFASKPSDTPSREAAMAAFEKLRTGSEQSLPEQNPIKDYVTDLAITYAEELDMTIAVHAGYWGDFRNLNPAHLIPYLQRHPKARFDLYHLGYPFIREALMLGKSFPNVWLNLCWVHVISPQCAINALDEALDLVPVNKVIGFGGDYHTPVEKIYGHLVIARENISRVLAGRVLAGGMTTTQALKIAERWLFMNPRELYQLKV